MRYVQCPKCGAAVNTGTTNGTCHCPKCKCTIVIQKSEVVGWR